MESTQYFMKNIMPIAMYLPQFHRIQENDMWWGEGFTDWVAVKNAKKLIHSQHQPRRPLNGNYYDLSEKSTMEWQAQIAKEYGGIGFCFYHYYFKNGRKILEKPAENLLKWKDIKQPFCFCWANESWARSWSNIPNRNVWSELYENESQNTESGILLEQKYGNQRAWKEHMEYLLPFFKDERYIKKDGKPIFLIYKPQEIVSLEEMAELWKDVAKENGLSGLEVIGINVPCPVPGGLDAILLHGPQAYLRKELTGTAIKVRKEKSIRLHDYQEVWNNALNCAGAYGINTYYGAFVDYDDSPRRGWNSTILENVDMDVLHQSLVKLVQKNICAGNEYLFINAWNEWGEGMYLEPDDETEYTYLEILQSAIREGVQNFSENMGVKNSVPIAPQTEESEESKELRKYKNYFKVLERWLTLKEQGKRLASYIEGLGYKKVAIYGWGMLGKHLYEELKDSKIEISYAIDRIGGYASHLKVVTPQDKWDDVDVIIVSATFDYKNIRQLIKTKLKADVISLEEIVMES